MKSNWNMRGPLTGLSLTLFAVTFTSAAVAQPDDAAAKGSTSASASTDAKASLSLGSGTSTEASASANADKTTDKKEEAAAAEGAKDNAEVAEPAPKPKTEPVPPPVSPEPGAASSAPLAVEILPSSGYPEPRVRGIVGGSLWLTMHGHQFPYMGPETSTSPARIAFSGSVWSDTSYSRINSGTQPNQPNLKRWLNQTRAVLRASPAYTTRDGWFAQGVMELVAYGDQLVQQNRVGVVDDAYARFGKWGLFDISVGRFQGWEVYHYGMGLDLNTLERRGAEVTGQPTLAPQIYGLSYYWDRADSGSGNYAAHVYFTDYLRLEVLGQIGTASSGAAAGANNRAVRPVAVLDLGYFKAKLGFEYGVATSQVDNDPSKTRRNGVGGALQFVANPYIEGGVNGAIGYVDNWNDNGLPMLRNSTTTKSFGGFLNGRIWGPIIAGVGANYTDVEDLDQNNIPTDPRYGKANEWNHLQTFFALQYSVWDKLFFKFVGSYAKFHLEDNRQDPAHPYTDSATSGRLRVMYLF